jgi:carbonic anhydrase/acetyltransferase-like protein (isoleucine patch superfamily)
VTLGLNSSVWYGATLIGTKGIKVGANSDIQDRPHLSSDVQIGDNVFVGPNCTIQGSVLDDYSFISMGATVRHAKV